MTQEVQRQSARIYQFPVGGRRSVEAARASADVREASAPRVTISYGNAWYHDAAIQDAKRVSER